MRLPISILLVIIFFACSDSESVNSRKVIFSFASGHAKVPLQYKPVSSERFREIIQKSDDSEDVITMRINKLDGLINSSIKFDIYVDTLNNDNNIIFLQGPTGIRLTTSLVKQYFDSMDEQTGKGMVPFGFHPKAIEREFSNDNGKELIKIKYEVTLYDTKSYLTYYLVVKNRKAVGVVVANQKNDFEKLIKAIEIR